MKTQWLTLIVTLLIPVSLGALIGDLNRDGKVDFADFFLFSDEFGKSGPPEPPDTFIVVRVDTLQRTVRDTLTVTKADTVTVVIVDTLRQEIEKIVRDTIRVSQPTAPPNLRYDGYYSRLYLFQPLVLEYLRFYSDGTFISMLLTNGAQLQDLHRDNPDVELRRYTIQGSKIISLQASDYGNMDIEGEIDSQGNLTLSIYNRMFPGNLPNPEIVKYSFSGNPPPPIDRSYRNYRAAAPETVYVPTGTGISGLEEAIILEELSNGNVRVRRANGTQLTLQPQTYCLWCWQYTSKSIYLKFGFATSILISPNGDVAKFWNQN